MIDFQLPSFTGLTLSATRKERLRERVMAPLVETAESIAEDVRAAAPVDKGNLRDSVRVETYPRELRVAIEAGGVPETERRGRFQGSPASFDEALETEYGTTKSAADPFFYPTIGRRRDEFGDAILDGGRDALDGDD